MPLSVKNQLIQNSEGRIKYFTPTGGTVDHYQIWLWIEGGADELDAINNVEYHFPTSFPKPVRTSWDRGTGFRVMFWTFGYFSIQIRVNFKDGKKNEFGYLLNYELPDDNGSNYVQVREVRV